MQYEVFISRIDEFTIIFKNDENNIVINLRVSDNRIQLQSTKEFRELRIEKWLFRTCVFQIPERSFQLCEESAKRHTVGTHTAFIPCYFTLILLLPPPSPLFLLISAVSYFFSSLFFAILSISRNLQTPCTSSSKEK